MQIEKEGVHVLFACKCMTYDRSETKFWYHGEYELLALHTLEDKLEQHKTHCPFSKSLVEAGTAVEITSNISSSFLTSPWGLGSFNPPWGSGMRF